MTSFSTEDLERFYDSYMAARGKFEVLAAAYAGKDFRDERARRFARHGFPCRLELMVHCIEGSMEGFPPRISWAPHVGSIEDATVCLQAFVANVRGCVDNLAHIWVAENGLRAEDGTPLPDSRIGLRPDNGTVLKSLSPYFAGRLTELGPWFEYLDKFRDALEHCAPLYVPRDSVPEDTLLQFGEIGKRAAEAGRREDHATADRLTREREAMVSFFPITAQAFGDNADKAVFHFQMATDFDTVEEVARKLLLEFD